MIEQGHRNRRRWFTRRNILVVVLGFAVSCSREPSRALFGAQQSVAFRLIATWDVDAEIAEAAQGITGRLVVVDEQVCAEWVPVGDAVALDGKKVANAVTRRTPLGTEVLVLHTVNDLTDKDIKTRKGFRDDTSGDYTVVTLTASGKKMFYEFTLLNRGRAVAVVADGEVVAVPLIVSPVSGTMILTAEEIDKVRLVP